jgi:hypothetical protein
MKKSELKQLIKEVIQEMQPSHTEKKHDYAEISFGPGNYAIIKRSDPKQVLHQFSRFDDLVKKWKQLTGEDLVGGMLDVPIDLDRGNQY